MTFLFCLPRRWQWIGLLLGLCLLVESRALQADMESFLGKHCLDCHDSTTRKGKLDLSQGKPDLANPEAFARWVKVFDKIDRNEMPPPKRVRPSRAEIEEVLPLLKKQLVEADQRKSGEGRRTILRRLTRSEYENTIRDLFDLSGIALQGDLPADGMAHGFDKNSDSLDISHVNMAKYIQAAEQALDMAIATRPSPPTVQKRRMSLANRGGFVAHVVLNGDGVLLRDKLPDPNFPPAGEQNHIDEGAHERMGTFQTGSSVGLFRHEDESFSPYLIEHVTIYPGSYRLSTSLWRFHWDKGKVLPSRGTESARLSVVQLTGDGRGGQHPSRVLGYYDAPSIQSLMHHEKVWLNANEIIGFNAASLAPAFNYSRKGRAMAFTGPGIACDFVEVEGPFHDQWPPMGHRALFGDLPLKEFISPGQSKVRPPVRQKTRQLGAAMNRPDPDVGLFTVQSDKPEEDSDRLLGQFLPKAFRRPVDPEVRKGYVNKVKERLAAGDCFETAMRWAYRAALCSPDFLFHYEPVGRLDDHALACRISYLLWNSLPDQPLRDLANSGKLRDPVVLQGQVERMLTDAKSQRFVEDFLGQWLKLRQIAATDPDKKLYPEFSSYLQDSMVGETRGYFRELLDRNLGAEFLVRSNFVMINSVLAKHYGIPGVTSSKIHKVKLPADCPRGGFLTQAAILKITSNGTTTSPVPRGAMVLERILGQPPEPPPPNITAIEPDVRGTQTIRQQLQKHRADPACASCHDKMDPPGFALESFDVIGGFRNRYRSIGAGDPAPRGWIDPFLAINFKLGPTVDPSGVLPDGRSFDGIKKYQEILAADAKGLLRNLAEQFVVYGVGRPLSFGDRPQIDTIVSKTMNKGGGIRTVVHEMIQSDLFQSK